MVSLRGICSGYDGGSAMIAMIAMIVGPHETMKLMLGLEVLLFCLCVLSLCSLSFSVENIKCTKINECKCVLSGGIRIDLTRLNNEAKW